MKKCMAFVLVFGFFLTAGCSSNEPSQDAAQPSEQKLILNLNESSQETMPEGLENPDEAIEHLEFYDQFDRYNEYAFFGEFILSEEWIDGEPYYQLLNEEKDVRILVDKTRENAVIYHNGKSMEYPIMLVLGTTPAYTAIDVLDVTNDGKDELIIAHGAGGTGVWEGTCDVFDLETFREYAIDEEKILKELGSRITVEPVAIVKNNYLKCRVKDYQGNVYFGYAWVSEDDNDISQYFYDPESFTGHYSFEVDLERQCLVVSGGIPISPMHANYLGDLRSSLVFDSATGSFKLSDELVVELTQLEE